MCADNKSDHSTDDDSEISHEAMSHQYTPLGYKLYRNKTVSRKRILAQTLVTGATMLTSAGCGMPVGYSAILLPQLQNNNDSMNINDELASWIASVHSAATPFGSLVSGMLMDRCGRKLVLQFASVPLILGWILIGFAQNHTFLLLGRAVAGLSAGLSAAAGQVLIGEITEPHLRGMLSSGPFVSYSFGILLVYALGSILPWRYVAGLSTILPFTAILVFLFLPESPVWLVRHNKIEKAGEALTWLRGGNHLQAKEETDHLVQRLQQETETKTSLKALLKPQVLKPLLIINLFNILQILSGTYLIVFYAVDILSHLNGESFDHFLAASLTACVRFLFTIISTLLLGVVGRRTLSLTSGIGTSLSALCLGVVLHQSCKENNLLMALFVLFYVASNTIGFFVLPGVMLGELFPAKVRGHAGGFTFMIFNFVLFGVAKIFPFVKSTIGISGVFWTFGASSLLASLFLYLMLPETKGKSLSYIEDYFQQNNLIWIRRDKNWENKFFNRNETERLNV
ncbi:facilitated trehalose transporter Tret1-like [Cylas formicarius]|uniref:facilitated trehalose transporter Tret1-like n=1 Tax=Cylas formicarius TaxID=197179 RepID=UPI0029588B82|nr:facilitated trehalose transporter Tret1-like [Cylas formicarius]